MGAVPTIDAGALRQALQRVRDRIAEAERRHGRPPGSVHLLAVSKTKPPEAVEAACDAGQRDFGENHLQDAMTKLDAVRRPGLVWHFIGPVQSNKTRAVAERFDWVHSVDRLKIARRLSDQRPAALPPLQVCLQVNVSGESTKSGIAPGALADLAVEVSGLPRLRLRGLMALPAPEHDFERQRRPFARLRGLLESLDTGGLALDTLSMGMTDDMEAAIAEGATMVRVGTAVFGARPPHPAAAAVNR